MNNKMNPKWKTTENKLVDSPISLIFSEQTAERVKHLNHSIYHTWKSWKRLGKIMKIKSSDMVCPREISQDPDFIPNRMDETFRIWETKGLTIFHKMFKDHAVDTFENLSKDYNLPSNHFFRYLKVRSYIITNIQSFQDPNPIVEHIFKVYEKPSFKNVTEQI